MLQRVRRALGRPRAGNVGTLDPLATGMLPICVGEATKVAGEILTGRKRYRFAVRLGARTASGDAEGPVVETCTVPALDAARIEAALAGLRGWQRQVPPMYSAIKQGGRPLYELARAGIETPRAAREIEIHELTLLACEPPVLELDVLCSKGTYVRVLAEDLARALGSCGHVSALRRLYVEPFEGQPMLTPEAVEAAAQDGSLSLLPRDEPLRHLPAVSLEPADALRLQHGQSILVGGAQAAGRVRLYDATGRFLGLGSVEPGSRVRPKRLLVFNAPR